MGRGEREAATPTTHQPVAPTHQPVAPTHQPTNPPTHQPLQKPTCVLQVHLRQALLDVLHCLGHAVAHAVRHVSGLRAGAAGGQQEQRGQRSAEGAGLRCGAAGAAEACMHGHNEIMYTHR